MAIAEILLYQLVSLAVGGLHENCPAEVSMPAIPFNASRPQVRVPFVLSMLDRFGRERHLNTTCLIDSGASPSLIIGMRRDDLFRFCKPPSCRKYVEVVVASGAVATYLSPKLRGLTMQVRDLERQGCWHEASPNMVIILPSNNTGHGCVIGLLGLEELRLSLVQHDVRLGRQFKGVRQPATKASWSSLTMP